jgi:hypothetical protein
LEPDVPAGRIDLDPVLPGSRRLLWIQGIQLAGSRLTVWVEDDAVGLRGLDRRIVVSRPG